MKHKIIADKYDMFLRNIEELYEQLCCVGQVVTDVKFRMKTYNGDYSAYRARYVAVVWSKRFTSAEVEQSLIDRGFTPTVQHIIATAERISNERGACGVDSSHIEEAIAAVELERAACLKDR
jgi:hypothetical protein